MSEEIGIESELIVEMTPRNGLAQSLRKASNVLRPSVKPFFSPKAASSKPWSAKPFIGTI